MTAVTNQEMYVLSALRAANENRTAAAAHVRSEWHTPAELRSRSYLDPTDFSEKRIHKIAAGLVGKGLLRRGKRGGATAYAITVDGLAAWGQGVNDAITVGTPAMGPGKHAAQASALAIEPRNVELSAARRVRLLAGFRELDINTQADLLEMVESWAFSGFVDADKREARALLGRIYETAGLV